ncbi:hypothetical protein MW925_003853 [Salmonella enterica]|nr:hypothetical protein [Salmonella enterica]ELW8656411.1 hypothetical protein [Salmonella enterica]
MSSESLGWAVICHPYHPLKDQRFTVLKTRSVSGVETLILHHSHRGSFSIPRDWTDWGMPVIYDDLSATYFNPDRLMELALLVARLSVGSSGNLKGD